MQFAPAFERLWDLAPVPCNLGEVSGKLNDIAAAQNYFTRALSMTEDPKDAIKTLWAWSCVESQVGAAQAGRCLPRLAIANLQDQLEREKSRETPPKHGELPMVGLIRKRKEVKGWDARLDHYTADFAEMTCGDEA